MKNKKLRTSAENKQYLFPFPDATMRQNTKDSGTTSHKRLEF